MDVLALPGVASGGERVLSSVRHVLPVPKYCVYLKPCTNNNLKLCSLGASSPNVFAGPWVGTGDENSQKVPPA